MQKYLKLAHMPVMTAIEPSIGAGAQPPRLSDDEGMISVQTDMSGIHSD